MSKKDKKKSKKKKLKLSAVTNIQELKSEPSFQVIDGPSSKSISGLMNEWMNHLRVDFAPPPQFVVLRKGTDATVEESWAAQQFQALKTLDGYNDDLKRIFKDIYGPVLTQRKLRIAETLIDDYCTAEAKASTIGNPKRLSAVLADIKDMTARCQ